MKVNARISDKRPAPVSHRFTDIVGIAIIATAIIGLLALTMPHTGILGEAFARFLRILFGRGAYIMPIAIAFVGVASISGKRRTGLSHFTWGLGLIFVCLVGSFATAVNGDYFDIDAISASGGYIGACVAYVSHGLLGSASLVGLGALMCVGVILCIDMPLRSIINLIPKPGAKSVEPVRTRGVDSGKDPLPTRAVVSPLTRRGAPVTRAMEDDEDDGLATVASPAPKPAKAIKWNEREAPAMPELSQETSAPKEGYQLPPLALLAEPAVKTTRSKVEMQKNIETLEGTLEQFGIDASVVEVAAGPTVTRYEIQLGPGIKVARITALADNIAMDLAASQVRVEAPIPGKAAIGVEVPNSTPTPVSLRELCETKEFLDHPSRLAVSLGKDVSGVNKYADLTKMPHLLIGGATNSGKSIGLSSIITSLLMRNTPKDLRLVMIDPKRVELTLFDRIPHLMCPVIKDVKEAPGVLRAVWREMDRRYDTFSEAGVRNIDGWNAKASFQDKMPYIVVIIDELADLMIQAAAEVETSICRLAQLARATGIHLVIATQRPSVDVITGTIKANIASRIAFAVSSQIDSRTILDSKGAEALIGRGDLLFLPIDQSKPLRVQGCYVSEAEIAAVCGFWRQQEPPRYTLTPEVDAVDQTKEAGDFGDQVDPLWEDAVRWAVERGQASTSMLQRKFSIGFQRASRLLDQMEERQIVGPRDGPRPREILISLMELDELFGGGSRVAGPSPSSNDESWD